VQGLRGDVHSVTQQKAHDMQPRMLIDHRAIERAKAVGAEFWRYEPADTPRVATGVVKRVDRLRCLGNAIVPQIAEIIGRAIVERMT
jgi:hypothetical protein